MSLPPRHPTILALELRSRDTGFLSSPTDLPVCLTVHVSRSQRKFRLHGGSSFDIRARGAALIRFDCRFWNVLLSWHRNHVQSSFGGCIPWCRQCTISLETDPNILPLGMSLRVKIVFDVARLSRVDCVVPTHRTVLAREPFCSPLTEYDVSRDHVLLAGFLCAQTFTRWVTSTAVGATLSSVRSISKLSAWEKARKRG